MGGGHKIMHFTSYKDSGVYLWMPREAGLLQKIEKEKKHKRLSV
jgi:hypothetical protein